MSPTSGDGSENAPLDGRRPTRLAGLPRRIYLTYRYRGFRSVLYQSLVFPLRLTPLDRVLNLGPGTGREALRARRWYHDHGRPVTIVIPSYRDARSVAQLVASIRRTTARDRVRIVVADDASGPEHLAALRPIEGVQVVAGKANGGFAVNANRGLRAADPTHDVVLLNSDVVPLRDWLAALQFAAYQRPGIGIAGAKLLYPDNRIQYAGTVRNRDAPEWFDHRYRFKPIDWGPANVPGPTLAATGAAMYIRRETLDRVGLLDEAYPMAYEDVDYGLRTWEAGFEVVYAPAAQLHHHESLTRGTTVGERERTSQRVFWKRWGPTLDERRARTDDGHLRVIYVTQGTGVGGGHRLIFEHLDGLAERGHHAELWTLDDPPDWFELRCPVRRFDSYEALSQALTPLDAIKVATWWKTATPVWRASVLHGVPVYYVQDIETSYYRDAPEERHAVINTYRPEFRYLTISHWNRDQLAEIGLEAEIVAPGIDHDTYRPLPDVTPADAMVLAVGRSVPLKNFPLTLAAWRRLPEPRPELCLFGVEPGIATDPGVRYITAPSDAEVNELLNRTTVFVQTSSHEGFCLPILEAMAAGAAVVCTDAHGNRDFCVDGVNCLMPEPNANAVASAIGRALGDRALRERLGAEGIATARRYTWDAQIDELERFLHALAGAPRSGASAADRA